MGKYTKKADRFFINFRENNGVKEKRCSICKNWLPETEEYYYMLSKSKPEKGFKSECKKCAIERAKIIQNNRNETERKEYFKKYYENNMEKFYDNRINYYNNNPIKYKEDQEIWKVKNPDRIKQYSQKRRLKKHNITEEQWIACKDYFKNDNSEWACAYCGLPQKDHWIKRKGKMINMDLHKEHVDDDGSDGLENCVPSCQSCNSKKRNYKFNEWYNSNNKRLKEGIYLEERYNKIIQWITEDYKQ